MTASQPQLEEHYQVIVVGFGPTGALCASLLGQRGIRTLAIDRSREVYGKPRAIAIDHEILRLWDNIGVADRVAPYMAPLPASQHFGAEGQLLREIDMVAPPYPLGYTPSISFSQPPVEAALRKQASSFPGVTVSLGTEQIGLAQAGGVVELHLRNGDHTISRVTADYVIGCDGASSSVRKHLGVAVEDLVFDEPWLVIDLLVKGHALGKLPPKAAQFCQPSRPALYIPGPANHRRWEIMLLPGEDPHAMENPEQVWHLLSRWITPDDAELWRATSYRFHALVATQWRSGRVFLAGDAAHQQPPFIGQGMCQGMRDVANLVWKLDRVIKGKSPSELLDTYGEERSAHVRELTTRIKAIGQQVCERDPEAARARDARILAEGGGVPRRITRQEIVPPLDRGFLGARLTSARGTLFPQPWIVHDGERVLLDKVCGTGWRLVVDGRSRADLPESLRARAATLDMSTIAVLPSAASMQAQEIGAGVDWLVVEAEGVMSRWFDAHKCRAALVRPDHYVFAAPANRSELEHDMSELESRLVRSQTTVA